MWFFEIKIIANCFFFEKKSFKGEKNWKYCIYDSLDTYIFFQVYEETEKLKADVSSYVKASDAKSNEKLLTDNYVKLNMAKMLSNNTKMYFSGGDSVLGAVLGKVFGTVNPN